MARTRLCDLEEGRRLYPVIEYWRPRTRAECALVQRPCPFVSCGHHLYLDVQRNGTVTINFPDMDPHELADSCVLDVADRGGMRLSAVADRMNISRERARHIVNEAIAKVRRLPMLMELR